MDRYDNVIPNSFNPFFATFIYKLGWSFPIKDCY